MRMSRLKRRLRDLAGCKTTNAFFLARLALNKNLWLELQVLKCGVTKTKTKRLYIEEGAKDEKRRVGDAIQKIL